MSNNTPTTTIKILDKEYQVSCPHDTQAELQQAAHYLHEKMRTIRATGKVIGLERIAVMAALNMSYELLQSRHQITDGQQETHEHIKRLVDKLDQALEPV